MVDMDKEQALAAFERTPAPTPSERLRAARLLARIVTTADRSRLSKIREAEHNSWVRKALDQALKRSGIHGSVASVAMDEVIGEAPLDTRLHEELRAQAIEETSAMFLHELRSLVGFLDAAANAEIARYACSRTNTNVVQIKSYLNALEKLQKASTAPAIQELDLTDLVVRVAEYEVTRGRATLDKSNRNVDKVTDFDGDAKQIAQPKVARLTLVRRDPVITKGDPALVEMAVVNALRNAIEAVYEVQREDQRDVILNWGVTDTDNWIVVLDEGCGLPPGWARLTEPGTRTKLKSEGHFGMGLPIAQRAIQSLQGSFQLTPRPNIGVSCTIRWPHGELV